MEHQSGNPAARTSQSPLRGHDAVVRLGKASPMQRADAAAVPFRGPRSIQGDSQSTSSDRSLRQHRNIPGLDEGLFDFEVAKETTDTTINRPISVRVSQSPLRGHDAVVRLGKASPMQRADAAAVPFRGPRSIQGDSQSTSSDRSLRQHRNIPGLDEGLFDFEVAADTADTAVSHPAIKYEEKKSRQCFPGCLLDAVRKFVKSITHPFYFVLFNVLCLVQAIPAITYYVLFFSLNWYVPKSTGMPAVWGATIGSIATVIATSPLVPLPPDTITKSFCIAIVIWEFWVSISLLVAGFCLGAQLDGHGCFWSLFGSLLTGCAAVFLRWLGLQKLEQLESESNMGNYDESSSYAGQETTDPLINSAVGTSSRGRGLIADRNMEQSRTGVMGPLDIPLHPLPAPVTDTDITIELGGPCGEQFSGGIEEDVARRTTTKKKKKPSSAAPATRTLLGSIRFYAVQFLLWAVLFVFAVIPAGFAVDQAYTAWEKANYKAPGSVYVVDSCVDSSKCRKISMHMHCVGPAATNRPTVVFEADNFTSGHIFWNLQEQLSEAGWRSCAYDRAGYGWSEMPPLGSTNPKDATRRLHQLLASAGEAQGTNSTILVGYGAGSELAQIYAYTYPERIAGFAILDGFSNLDRLLDHSTKSIHKDTLERCGNLNIGRAVESVSMMRAVTNYFAKQAIRQKSGFVPSYEYDRYMSTLTNGKYWEAQFNDLCMHAGAASANTDYLTRLVGNNQNSTGSALENYLGNTKWPTLRRDVPVLIVTAGKTALGNDLTSTVYHEQARRYNETLSPNRKSRWITCTNCRHSMAYDDRSYWLAAKLDTYFGDFFP